MHLFFFCNLKINNSYEYLLHRDFMSYIQHISFSRNIQMDVQLNDEFIQSFQNSRSYNETNLDKDIIKIQLEDIASHPAVNK